MNTKDSLTTHTAQNSGADISPTTNAGTTAPTQNSAAFAQNSAAFAPATKVLGPKPMTSDTKAENTSSKGENTAKDSVQSKPFYYYGPSFNKSVYDYGHKFFNGQEWVKGSDTVQFVGVSGEPVPYKLSNDVFVTSTLLACFFLASFVVSRSMKALKLQVKNFFYNRDRKEDFSLKSEGEVKNQSFVVLLECFVLSLLFFSYSEFKLINVFTEVSPYMILFTDMGVCIAYFLIKYMGYSLFNWTFFDSDDRKLWFSSYNLTLLGKSMVLLPLALVIVYFNLPLALCISLFIVVMGIYEFLVFFKSNQIFFKMRYGLVLSFLYFCTLELIPLASLCVMLIKINEYLIV